MISVFKHGLKESKNATRASSSGPVSARRLRSSKISNKQHIDTENGIERRLTSHSIDPAVIRAECPHRKIQLVFHTPVLTVSNSQISSTPLCLCHLLVSVVEEESRQIWYSKICSQHPDHHLYLFSASSSKAGLVFESMSL